MLLGRSVVWQEGLRELQLRLVSERSQLHSHQRVAMLRVLRCPGKDQLLRRSDFAVDPGMNQALTLDEHVDPKGTAHAHIQLSKRNRRGFRAHPVPHTLRGCPGVKDRLRARGQNTSDSQQRWIGAVQGLHRFTSADYHSYSAREPSDG